MKSKYLSEAALEELEHLVLPLVRNAKTFNDLMTIASYIDGLVMTEDEHEQVRIQKIKG